jgi:predicted AAA+ superfamily ATPase
MLSLLQPYYINVGKRLVKAPKLYLNDSGLVHALLYLNDYNTLLGHPQSGNSWEGYVIEEIRKTTGHAWQYYFYRTHNGAECDLFCITGKGQKIAIEIKPTNSPAISRGFYQSIQDLQPDSSYVIVPDVTPYRQKDGITIIGLEWFLKEAVTSFSG